MSKWTMLPGVFAAFAAMAASADSTAARCDIYPRGSDRLSTMLACTFSQRQGAITIARSDGVTYELAPVGDQPGNYRDQDGKPAYRQSGLGDQGQIFRLARESVYVYWDTSALHPQDAVDNPTAPFTTADYDATTLLRCRAAGAGDFGSCPAGVLRMADGQASIVVLSPGGEKFTMNFMQDYVNASNREVSAELNGDTWTVTLSDGETYEVPLAAIVGD
ncbi:MAG: hypothetical protein R3F42_02540 [Pseudomonadota bacterium]